MTFAPATDAQKPIAGDFVEVGARACKVMCAHVRAQGYAPRVPILACTYHSSVPTRLVPVLF
jgi:hypothetical protein